MPLKKPEWPEWRLAALFMFTHTVTAYSLQITVNLDALANLAATLLLPC
jgi:hypothetical protein